MCIHAPRPPAQELCSWAENHGQMRKKHARWIHARARKNPARAEPGGVGGYWRLRCWAATPELRDRSPFSLRQPDRPGRIGIAGTHRRRNRKPRSGRSGVDWVWRPGVGPPGEVTLEQSADRRLTQACAELAVTLRAALTSQFRHRPAQLQTHPLATLCGHGEAMGETWRAASGVASWIRSSGHSPPRRRLASWSWSSASCCWR